MARFFKAFQETVPEFVFYKNGQVGLNQPEKIPDVPGSICRQISNRIGERVVFSDLISGRREKGEEDKHMGVLRFHGLDHRPSLFKFSEGGAMHPYKRLSGLPATGNLIL